MSVGETLLDGSDRIVSDPNGFLDRELFLFDSLESYCWGWPLGFIPGDWVTVIRPLLFAANAAGNFFAGQASEQNVGGELNKRSFAPWRAIDRLARPIKVLFRQVEVALGCC